MTLDVVILCAKGSEGILLVKQMFLTDMHTSGGRGLVVVLNTFPTHTAKAKLISAIHSTKEVL